MAVNRKTCLTILRLVAVELALFLLVLMIVASVPVIQRYQDKSKARQLRRLNLIQQDITQTEVPIYTHVRSPEGCWDISPEGCEHLITLVYADHTKLPKYQTDLEKLGWSKIASVQDGDSGITTYYEKVVDMQQVCTEFQDVYNPGMYDFVTSLAPNDKHLIVIKVNARPCYEMI